MPKKITLPQNEVLLYILSAATAATLIWALIYIDGGQSDFFGKAFVIVRGVLLGIASGFATAVVSQRAQRVKAKEAKQWAIGGLAAMLIAELTIVTAVTYSTMNPAMLGLAWPIRLLISFAAGAFIPAVSIGIASTSGALQADEQPVAQVAQEVKPTKKAAKDAAQVAQADAAQPEHVAQVAPVVAQVVAPVAQVAQEQKPELTDENLIAQWLANPIATDEELAQVFGKSRQAIGNRRNALAKQGRIRKDGKAVRVLPVFVEVGA
jgi:hypothetical protein